MRPVLHEDLTCAARALLAVSQGQRWKTARDLIARADAADRYRRRMGKAHPDWGNGTLMAAALALPVVPEARLDDVKYVECMILVLEALRLWRLRRWHRPIAKPEQAGCRAASPPIPVRRTSRPPVAGSVGT